MSATLADPYRDYTVDYAHHANSKAEGHGNLLVYPPNQAHTHHNKPTEVSFPPGNSHQQSAFDQSHHANPPSLPGAAPQPTVHDISQAVLLAPDQMLSRQLPPQFASANLELPPVPRGRKRTHAEADENSGDADHGIRPHLPLLPEAPGDNTHSADLLFSVHGGPSSPHYQPSSHRGFGPPDSVGLPHHHHHHQLPHAGLHSPPTHGVPVASPSLPSGPPSVVGHPGMPDPAPRPRGPKLKFSPEEDALLVELKENKNLTWKQIADFFPGRTSGTLQVRYCTKLKAKDVVWTDEMVAFFRTGSLNPTC